MNKLIIYVFLYQNLKGVGYRRTEEQFRIYVFLYQNLKDVPSSYWGTLDIIYVFLYQNLKSFYKVSDVEVIKFMYFYIRI